MNNSGRELLRMPGFGDIPLNLQHPGVARFAHGFGGWRQSPTITAQEQAMVLVMDRLSDTQLDADRERTRQDSSGRTKSDILLANPRLFGGQTWTWCVQKLRDKARSFPDHNHVRVLDTGSCVCKSDSAALGTLGTALQRAVEPLSDAVVQRTGYYGEHPVRQTEDGDRGQDENRSAVELPSRSSTAVSAEEAVSIPREVNMQEVLDVPDMPVSDAADVGIIPSAASIQYSEDYIEYTGSTPSHYTDSADDVFLFWELPHGGKLLNNDGSAHLVRTLVDPLAFPLVFGRTPVLQQGGAVALDDILGLYAGAEKAPYPESVVCSKTKKTFTFSDGSTSKKKVWCEKYQGLPCEVAFTADNRITGTSTAVRITSYINGLHPGQREIYTIIEQVLSRCIQPWNDCLVRGHHDAYDQDNHDQLGCVSARIITFGIQWINELPSWVTAFNIPPPWKPDPNFVLPPVKSDLWQLALKYLKRPGCVDPDDWLADWAPGDSRTWNLLLEKADRLEKFKHPEPGTAFSYDDWKTGQHGDRAIVDRVPVKMIQEELSATDELCQLRNASLLLAKCLTKNEPVEEDEQSDTDGWRLAGRLNERVVAVAVFVFDADNVTAPLISFRQRTGVDSGQYWFRGPTGNNGYDSDDDRSAYAPLHNDISTLGEIFAMPALGTFASRSLPPYPYQHMGSVSLLSPQSAASEGNQGHLVTFPNLIEHRIERFRLVDATQPGRLRWLTLHLVDPHYRICSTRNVLPQQHSWWAVPVSEALADKGMPAELISQILHDTEDWPMGVEEAGAHLAGFMKEAEHVRQYYKSGYWV
ncbi:hypothetical protein F503_04056 [Ophiostoma piceae UAMH 11346]|uniref:DUF4246 domain-containing protein n=1 Tax=Ophiostoma piceae (strain UAMH 11346) TaxID=1262450 RepID=S3BQS5_OPHP1|nr:hypothetical protein F503_04056 [Ophiostoma piceae UAMH 11346]